MIPEHVIKRPLVLTEKGTGLREAENQYLFEVSRDANTAQIRNAVEPLFHVTVKQVRTLLVRGRMRRIGRGKEKTQNWKKAIVSLAEGDSIDFFEGA